MSFLGLLFLAFVSTNMLVGCDEPDGATLLLAARTPGVVSNAQIEQARAVVARRIQAIGGTDADVVRSGSGQILVRLDRNADVAMARSLIGRRGRLEFKTVSKVQPSAEILASRRAPNGLQFLPLRYGGFVAVQGRPVIGGERIVRAEPGFTHQGEPDVSITFDAEGGRQFAFYTRDHVGELFAIVVDDVVISTPMIVEPILGGRASIAGGFTVDEAAQLAIALQSGALPIDLEVIEERAP